MVFNAEEFLEKVTWEAFDELKIPDLMTLAKELNLDVKHAMRKQEIKNMLIDRLVDDDLLDSFTLVWITKFLLMIVQIVRSD